MSHTMKLAKALIQGQALSNLKAMRLCRATSAERRLRELRADMAGNNINVQESWEANKNGGQHKVWWLGPSDRKRLRKMVGA